MIEATRRWFQRNRTRLAIGAGAVGAVYLAGQYAWNKWLEARLRMGEDRIAKENLRRRFEQNQEDCTFTVLALLPTVRDEVIGSLPVEEIVDELQKQKAERSSRSATGMSEVASTDLPSRAPSVMDEDRSSLGGSYIHASQMAQSGDGASFRPKRTKAQLWYDMKIQSITRAITLLYTLSLLTLLTRIQLNLLGRRTYLSSVVSLASPPTGQQASVISLENNDDDNYDNAYGNDFETNRKYLTFSWWLLHRGCKEITEKVQAAVKEVFGPVNPREDINLERMSNLILEIRKKIEGATEVERREQKWLPFLLPPQDREDSVLREPGSPISPESPMPHSDPLDSSNSQPSNITPSLRRLLDETSDLIDSPTFTHVLTLLLNTCFSKLIDDRIAMEAFKVTSTDPASRIVDITDRKCKIANTLAVFCRQAHNIAAGSGEMDELSATADAVPNEYLAAIDQVRDLEAFAAVIYSSNFDFEAVQAEQQLEQASMQAAAQLPEPRQLTGEKAHEDLPDLPKVTDEQYAAQVSGMEKEQPTQETTQERNETAQEHRQMMEESTQEHPQMMQEPPHRHPEIMDELMEAQPQTTEGPSVEDSQVMQESPQRHPEIMDELLEAQPSRTQRPTEEPPQMTVPDSWPLPGPNSTAGINLQQGVVDTKSSRITQPQVDLPEAEMGASFESAWQSALKDEDGQKE